jgi:integrase
MSVTISEKDKPKVKRSDLPGPEHVKEALTSLNKLRDRALIFLTWDSGVRIGEVLNLKWKDVEFRDNGLKIHIRESKSMQREIFLGERQQTLREWKNQSEYDGREDYVFVKIGTKNQDRKDKGNQLQYRAAKAVFDKLDRRLESEVKTNPHSFRKARATYLASEGWNAAQLCEQSGWNDFETAEYYINLHKSDVETAMKDTLDIETEERNEGMDLASSQCKRCGELNPGR